MTAVLAAAVAPLVPTRPFSARMTLRAAFDCRDRRPAPGGTAANDKNVGCQVEAGGPGAARSLLRLTIEHEVDFNERVPAELGDPDGRA